MPAYSFKERFVPMIKDGTKRQTIRAFRKSAPRPGTLAHLYYGMRTRQCVRLLPNSPKIIDVQCIFIDDTGSVALIDKAFLSQLIIDNIHIYGAKFLKNVAPAADDFKITWLTKDQRNQLAFDDGFRASLDHFADENFELMCRFWRQTHSLPFIGNIIYW